MVMSRRSNATRCIYVYLLVVHSRNASIIFNAATELSPLQQLHVRKLKAKMVACSQTQYSAAATVHWHRR
jgi:ribosomal protein S3AE